MAMQSNVAMETPVVHGKVICKWFLFCWQDGQRVGLLEFLGFAKFNGLYMVNQSYLWNYMDSYGFIRMYNDL